MQTSAVLMRAGMMIVLIGLPAQNAECGERAERSLTGECDLQARQFLGESVRVLKLRETTVREIAPELAVDKEAGLSWEAALRQANTRYANDINRRALFLRKYIHVGDGEMHISELNLKHPNPSATTLTGAGRTSTFALATPSGTGPRQPTLTFLVARGGRVVQTATLNFGRTEMRGIEFDHLGFDLDDRLIDFGRTVVLPKQKLKLIVGGNTSGTDGGDYFWAQVTEQDGRLRESIGFSPTLQILRRDVSDSASGKPKYRETYENGRLRRRDYFAQRVNEHGTETFVVRSEEF